MHVALHILQVIIYICTRAPLYTLWGHVRKPLSKPDIALYRTLRLSCRLVSRYKKHVTSEIRRLHHTTKTHKHRLMRARRSLALQSVVPVVRCVESKEGPGDACDPVHAFSVRGRECAYMPPALSTPQVKSSEVDSSRVESRQAESSRVESAVARVTRGWILAPCSSLAACLY